MTDTSTMAALPEAAEESVVEQQKMAPTLQEYMKVLEQHPFVHDFRIDTHNPIGPQIAAHWLHLPGYEEQEEELIGRMVGVISKMPNIQNRQDGNMPIVYMRVIIGAEKQVPIATLEPHETQVLGSWDSDDGTVRSCVVLPAHELPALDHMAISSGMIMVSQTETGFYDESKDMRIWGFGGGPPGYDTERSRDKMPKPNELGEGPFINNPTPPWQQMLHPDGLAHGSEHIPQEESGPANAELLGKEADAAAIAAGIVAAEEVHRMEERTREERHKHEEHLRQEALRETEHTRLEKLRHEKMHHEAARREGEARHRNAPAYSGGMGHSVGAEHVAGGGHIDASQHDGGVEHAAEAMAVGEALHQGVQQHQPGAAQHQAHGAVAAPHEVNEAEGNALSVSDLAIAEAEVTSAGANNEQLLDSAQLEPQRPETVTGEAVVAGAATGEGAAQEGAVIEAAQSEGAGVAEPRSIIEGTPVDGAAGSEAAAGNLESSSATNNRSDDNNAGAEAQQSEISPEEIEQLESQPEQAEQAEQEQTPTSEASGQGENPESSQNVEPENQAPSQEGETEEEEIHLEEENEPRSEQEGQREESPEQARGESDKPSPQENEQSAEGNREPENEEIHLEEPESEPRSEPEGEREEAPEPARGESDEPSPQEKEQSAEGNREPENKGSSENTEARDVNESNADDVHDVHAEAEAEDIRSENRGVEGKEDFAVDAEEGHNIERGSGEGRRIAGAENAEFVETTGAETLDQNQQQDNQQQPVSEEVLRHSLNEATMHHMIETSLGHNGAAAHTAGNAATVHGGAMTGGTATVVHQPPSSLPPAPNFSGVNARPSIRHLALAETSAIAAIAGAKGRKTSRQSKPDAMAATPGQKRAAQALAIKQPVVRAKSPRVAKKKLLKKELLVEKKKVHHAQQEQISTAAPTPPVAPAPTLDI